MKIIIKKSRVQMLVNNKMILLIFLFWGNLIWGQNKIINDFGLIWELKPNGDSLLFRGIECEQNIRMINVEFNFFENYFLKMVSFNNDTLVEPSSISNDVITLEQKNNSLVIKIYFGSKMHLLVHYYNIKRKLQSEYLNIFNWNDLVVGHPQEYGFGFSGSSIDEKYDVFVYVLTDVDNNGKISKVHLNDYSKIRPVLVLQYFEWPLQVPK